MGIENKTGIYQTRDELKVRRVLSWATETKLNPSFSYKDGWYQVWIPETTAGSYYARMATTFASTDLQPQHLSAFQQEEL